MTRISVPTEKGKTMDKLKQCPFCGGRSMLINLPYSRKIFVKCADQCCEQSIIYKTREEAIEAWNRRAEAKPAEIDFDYEAED